MCQEAGVDAVVTSIVAGGVAMDTLFSAFIAVVLLLSVGAILVGFGARRGRLYRGYFILFSVITFGFGAFILIRIVLDG